MSLNATNFVVKGPIKSADMKQFVDLFTGVMTDQPVTFKNAVVVGGSQGSSTAPLKLYGAVGQTGHLLDLYSDPSSANPGWGIGASGAMAWGPGGAGAQDTFLSRVAMQNGHATDTAGLLISPYLEVVGSISATSYLFTNQATLTGPAGNPFQININQDLSIARDALAAGNLNLTGGASAVNLTSSGALISQGASGTQQIGLSTDVRIARSMVIGTGGGFTTPVTASPNAMLTLSSTPTTGAYAILINSTLTSSNIGVLAVNSFPTSTVTGFVDAIQISTTFGSGSWLLGSNTGLHIYSPARGSGGNVTVSHCYGIIIDNQGTISVGTGGDVFGIVINAQTTGQTCGGIMIHGGTAIGSPALIIDMAAFISCVNSGGGWEPVFQRAGDNANNFFSGNGGFAITNYQNTARLMTMTNAGITTFNQDVTVYTLHVTFNTIWLYQDNQRKFYANGGNISYGCGSGAAHSFEFTAGGFAPCAASAFNVGSDKRLKDNIRPLEGALDILYDDRLHAQRYTLRSTGEECVGFVANDWQDVLPEVLSTNRAPEGDLGDILTLSYDHLSAVTFEALKQYALTTNARLQALERKLAA